MNETIQGRAAATTTAATTTAATTTAATTTARAKQATLQTYDKLRPKMV